MDVTVVLAVFERMSAYGSIAGRVDDSPAVEFSIVFALSVLYTAA